MAPKKINLDAAQDVAALAATRRSFVDAGWVSLDERKRQEEQKARDQAEYEAEIKDGFDAAQAARARFEAEPDAEYGFHLHHEVLYEKIKGDAGATGLAGANERIDFIVTSKRLEELVPRLRVMRPIPNDRLPESIDLDQALTAARAAKEAAAATYSVAKLARDRARTAAETAWSNFIYTPTEERRNTLMRLVDTYLAARFEVNEPEKTLLKADSEYRRLNGLRSTDRVFADADMYALHKELCEADCPYTEDHKSVIPKAG